MNNKKKGSWNQDSLKTALDKIMTNTMSIREASLRYNIPKSTLFDKLKSLKSGQEITLQPKLR